MRTPTFRMAVVHDPGGPDSIEIIHVPVVEPGPGEVRVQVAAASVNPVDVAVAHGRFHAMGLIHQPERTGLGWDFAGTIAAVGPDVDLPVGIRVAGVVTGFDRDFGTHAEQLVVLAAGVAIVPDSLDLQVAATVPLNGLAASQAVELLGNPRPGHDRLLVSGAAGAVGGCATVLAQDRGWRVTGLARAEDEHFVLSLGARFASRADAGWDAVMDAAGLVEDALALVRDGGRYVGVLPSNVPATERGITTVAVETQMDTAQLEALLTRAAAGELPARVHAVLPLERIADAHRAVEKGGVRGRYVLTP